MLSVWAGVKEGASVGEGKGGDGSYTSDLVINTQTSLKEAVVQVVSESVRLSHIGSHFV